MIDPERKTSANVVDDLAEDFACRWRAGERPTVDEYAERFPPLADEIKAVLGAVVMMEQLKPRRDDTIDLHGPAPRSDTMPARVGEYCIVREIGRGEIGRA